MLVTRSVFAVGAFALVACGGSSSNDNASGSSSGTPPPGTDGGGVDATLPGTDAGGGTDAGTDSAPGTDAAPPGDGGRDFGTDAGAFFGNTRCAQANVQLCEDFESGALDTKVWTVNGNAPVIDGVHVARGNKALHVSKTGNGASYIKETKTFPAVNNTYFGRAFVWFSQLPTAPGMTYAHWTFIAASGTGTQGEIRLSGQLQNGKNLFGVGTDSGNDPNGTGDWTNSDDDPAGAPTPVPTGKWACIEWMHDGATNETRFWWDAVEHPSLYTSSTKHGGNAKPYILPTFTNVWLGWQEYQTSAEPFELWLDEIAIDKERIGCVL